MTLAIEKYKCQNCSIEKIFWSKVNEKEGAPQVKYGVCPFCKKERKFTRVHDHESVGGKT
jgi:hypothetical protein